MQERHLYEYAVIRFVPKVEREEFINVGIVLFSKRCKYLKSLYTIDENKLKLFSPHPGFSTDLDNTLERLFKELVV